MNKESIRVSAKEIFTQPVKFTKEYRRFIPALSFAEAGITFGALDIASGDEVITNTAAIVAACIINALIAAAIATDVVRKRRSAHKTVVQKSESLSGSF